MDHTRQVMLVCGRTGSGRMNQMLCRLALGVSLALGAGFTPAYAQPEAMVITADKENVV